MTQQLFDQKCLKINYVCLIKYGHLVSLNGVSLVPCILFVLLNKCILRFIRLLVSCFSSCILSMLTKRNLVNLGPTKSLQCLLSSLSTCMCLFICLFVLFCSLSLLFPIVKIFLWSDFVLCYIHLLCYFWHLCHCWLKNHCISYPYKYDCDYLYIKVLWNSQYLKL